MNSTREEAVLAELGARVRELRLSHGWSQEECAAQANIHRTYIGGIERGERNITIVSLVKLAAALDVDPARLVEGLPGEGPASG